MVDVTEILIHWHAGRSQSEIATSLGVDRKTVKKYVVPAIDAGIVPGDALRSSEQWAELVRLWWPGLVDTRLPAGDVAADRGSSPVRGGHARRRGDTADDLAAAA